MPTYEHISDCLKRRMSQDVGDKINQAGNLWDSLPFSFYYQKNEDVIDIVIVEAERLAIAPRNLPNIVWEALTSQINNTTVIKNAVYSMWLASFRAK